METSGRAERAPITVVLLNYNGGDAVMRCARSLAAQTTPPLRVLFVDNGSSEFNEAEIRAAFGSSLADSVRCERLQSNCGYVLGMNHGLGIVLGDSTAPEWVMTLSNDTQLDPQFFERFAEEVAHFPRDERLSSVGMIAPKLLADQDRQRLDGTGLVLSLDGMSTARGQREVDRGQYDAATRVLCPNGVAAVYRVELLRQVGLFDEQFWAYCEDTDLGLRAWLAGWDCRFLPECIVFHARSSTLGEHSLRKLYLVERNHYWVALKSFPWPMLPLLPALTSYRFLVQAYALLAGRGQGRGFGGRHATLDLLKTTLRAVAAAGGGAPAVLRKRFAGRKLRQRDLREQLGVLLGERLSFADLILK